MGPGEWKQLHFPCSSSSHISSKTTRTRNGWKCWGWSLKDPSLMPSGQALGSHSLELGKCSGRWVLPYAISFLFLLGNSLLQIPFLAVSGSTLVYEVFESSLIFFQCKSFCCNSERCLFADILGKTLGYIEMSLPQAEQLEETVTLGELGRGVSINNFIFAPNNKRHFGLDKP